MDRETAIEFEKRIESAFRQMAEVIEFLRPRLGDGDYRTFGELWGSIICELDLGVLEVVYRAYPELRPEGISAVTPLGSGCRRYTSKAESRKAPAEAEGEIFRAVNP
jgi:hypothetical protein